MLFVRIGAAQDSPSTFVFSSQLNAMSFAKHIINQLMNVTCRRLVKPKSFESRYPGDASASVRPALDYLNLFWR